MTALEHVQQLQGARPLNKWFAIGRAYCAGQCTLSGLQYAQDTLQQYSPVDSSDKYAANAAAFWLRSLGLLRPAPEQHLAEANAQAYMSQLHNRAFAYLVGTTKRYQDDLKVSLSRLKAYYLDRYPARVILVHRGIEQQLRDISEQAQVAVELRQVELLPPPDIDRAMLCGSVHPDYLGMIQYYAHGIYQDLDPRWIVRLDTDSMFTGPVQYNLFDQFGQAQYGYHNAAIREQPGYLTGLYECVRQYLDNEKPRQYRDLHELMDGRLYYANFEISDAAWFRGPAWQSFMGHIIEAGGIWTHRWSDCVIKYLGVNLLCPPEHIKFYNLPYEHQGYGCQEDDLCASL